MLTDLALYSDRLFMAAAGVYLLAMVLHALEYSSTRTPKAVLVGAGGPEVEQADVPAEVPAGRSRTDRLGRMGVALVILGVVLHLTSIVLRGITAGRWPLGNMYEFTAAITLAAVVTWLLVLRKAPSARPVGMFVLLPVLILMFLGGTVLYTRAAPVMPALQSYWLVIHVTAISISCGLLLVPGVASVLFLLRRSSLFPQFTAKLPTADRLDRVAYRTTIIGLPLYTFAVICGAIWAEAAWGRFWGWDPKETVAFIAWVIYAGYLHARATAGWRAERAAWINVAGFATMIFNLFFINMVVAGLHSYAGLG
ncbi:c-type cytochrome biogenesis protein CcsB [Pseudonocardia sp. GCM10023141]|uniref:c-type cytochrome biogenesis protein CcsB n=1 Tax=Pseudonocardia sp. GCM10023141 TaxID=3252653 RepID=UPI003619038D